ncbi:FtsB family cell division protein [Calidifontibacillus oryziterrae]|uniref:FtsB family cell division protein n=1 Tax=Calidifontibacillus oryziterrae TaxID=1191699 RepID=UPI0002DF36B9|nr:septum formation initiator family protein [Calidifontibacillus oryziterrae]
MEPARSRKLTTLHSSYVSEQADKQQENKKRRRGLYRRLMMIGILALIISIGMGSTILSQSKTAAQKLTEKQELETRFEELKQQEQLHREEIVKLKNDEYVAKIARSEYFLSEEGEIIFKLPNE